MNEIIIVAPPMNCWANGYAVSKGNNESSINLTTVYASENKIVADQDRIKKSFNDLKTTLESIGCKVTILTFPSELDTDDCYHHDGVFIRDVGMMYKNKWIVANFSAKNRQLEAEVYSKIIHSKFDKEIIRLPFGAFLEFGEVYFLQTSKGSFYFGGLSRANKKGHDFVKTIINPDYYYLIESKGYHLDTVFTPVLSSDNELIAVIVAEDMLEEKSFVMLEELGIEIIAVNNKDTSDIDGMGNYAVNCLVANGILISGAHFTTPNVEKKLKELQIEFYVVPLIDYNFSGGSVHCLTNEIYT